MESCFHFIIDNCILPAGVLYVHFRDVWGGSLESYSQSGTENIQKEEYIWCKQAYVDLDTQNCWVLWIASSHQRGWN